MKYKTCGSLIKIIHDSFEREANNTMRPQGLTAAQGTALQILFNEGNGQMTLKEFEKHLHVAQSTAAGIVARLEQKGFVKCLGDPKDRRIKIVHLTKSGEECCRLGNAHLAATEDRVFSPLSEDEHRELFRLLDKVYDSL
jgi:DNA-binding MarR family transcriptional regulator